jgi:hypothetical protein
MRTSHFWTAATLTATLFCAGAESSHAANAGRLATYRQNNQASYALSLTADLPKKELDGVDVVVLFDTSASQQGAYRETALESLKTLVAGMRPSDRVQVLAVDLKSKPLAEAFMKPQDAGVQGAIDALGKQAPLGSTDMVAALNAAVQQFDKAGSKNRAIVYIGDGVSMANLLDAPTMGPLVEKLRAAHAPVSSYAVGPEVDAQLLAVLANQTGGNLYVAEPMVWQDDKAQVTDARAREENMRNAASVGKYLVAWTKAAVVWPTKAQLPSILGQVYPASFPPLRADRDTVVLGRTPADLVQPVAVQVTVAGSDGKPLQLDWSVKPEPPKADNAYLASIVEWASRDGGMTLPTVGMAGLAEVARLKGAEADQLTMLAERAIASGDRAGAKRIIQTVLKADPGNVQARTVQTALQNPTPQATGPEGIQPPVPAPPAAAPPAATAPATGDIILNAPPQAAAPVPPAEPGLLERRGPSGAFLDEVEQERKAFTQMIEAEVRNTISDARERVSTEPQLAIQDLKLQLENVRRAPELDAARRASL